LRNKIETYLTHSLIFMAIVVFSNANIRNRGSKINQKFMHSLHMANINLYEIFLAIWMFRHFDQGRNLVLSFRTKRRILKISQSSNSFEMTSMLFRHFDQREKSCFVIPVALSFRTKRGILKISQSSDSFEMTMMLFRHFDQRKKSYFINPNDLSFRTSVRNLKDFSVVKLLRNDNDAVPSFRPEGEILFINPNDLSFRTDVRNL
jgi:hypothetical protein